MFVLHSIFLFQFGDRYWPQTKCELTGGADIVTAASCLVRETLYGQVGQQVENPFIRLEFVVSNIKHIFSQSEEQLQCDRAEFENACMLQEVAVVICHQFLTGVLQWRLTLLQLSSDLHARSLEPIQSDQLVLVRVSYQQPFPQFARLVGLREESWLFSNFLPFRMMEDAALPSSFITSPRSAPSVRPRLWPLEEVLSDLRAWLNLNSAEPKFQRWSRLNEENTSYAVPEPNKIHHVWCFHRCEADSFAWETFHFSLSEAQYVSRSWGTIHLWTTPIEAVEQMGRETTLECKTSSASANPWP